MSLTAPERETIINFNDGEDIAYIYTAQRKIITKLKKNPSATLKEEGVFEGTAWARFTIPANLISFRVARPKRELSQEQRAEIGERLKRNRT
jgi:hypothetical protein